MRFPRLLLPFLLGTCLLPLAGTLPADQEPPAAPQGATSPPALASKDAERLFLSYINNPKSLIRNCMFLGGVRVEEITGTNLMATAMIRYRIECSQEEITLPPLTRTMRESFVYRNLGEHWELLGRASEIRPGEGDTSSPAPSVQPAAPMDPRDRDRADLVRQILTWAVLGKAPGGERKPYPGVAGQAWKSPLLISSENLGGVEDFTLGSFKVIVLSPEALLQRSVVENGGVWFRFDALEIEGDSARVRVGLVSPVLPYPRPGAAQTRTLSGMEADFLRRGDSWVLTRYRPAG